LEEQLLGGDSILVSTGADFFRHIFVNTVPTDVSQRAIALVFTAANWMTPQTVNVFAVDDPLAEGDRVVTVSHSVISADSAYDHAAGRNVEVKVLDNDLPNVVLTQLDPVTRHADNNTIVLEGDATTEMIDQYTIELAKAPATGKTV